MFKTGVEHRTTGKNILVGLTIPFLEFMPPGPVTSSLPRYLLGLMWFKVGLVCSEQVFPDSEMRGLDRYAATGV